ncbi:MAG: ribonuclease D [Paracoccaceae bacterium]|nr:ribonuclease D [Paracoccaceae bacterium]
MALVSSTDELNKFCSEVLEMSEYVTIDTEFVRKNTYYAKLCLVQLGFKTRGSKNVVLIDPLVRELNLTPLKRLLENKKITKIIHAGRQDLEIFLHLFDFLPVPLFDTQIAAMVCGMGEQESYESLVKKLVGKQLDKQYQYTDWSKRPLSAEQLKYASEDVSFLCDIFEILKRKLSDLGRSDWVIEEIEKLTNRDSYTSKETSSLKKIKNVNGNIHFKNLVAALVDLRELIAQELNLPRNHVIRDSLILKLAKNLPKNREELKELKIFSSKINVTAYYSKILNICNDQKLLTKNPVIISANQKTSDYTMNVVNLLKILLKIKSVELRVATKLIATTKDLETIASEKNPDVPALKGWRRQIFGLEALKLKEGKIALSVKGHGIKIVNV